MGYEINFCNIYVMFLMVIEKHDANSYKSTF